MGSVGRQTVSTNTRRRGHPLLRAAESARARPASSRASRPSARTARRGDRRRWVRGRAERRRHAPEGHRRAPRRSRLPRSSRPQPGRGRHHGGVALFPRRRQRSRARVHPARHAARVGSARRGLGRPSTPRRSRGLDARHARGLVVRAGSAADAARTFVADRGLPRQLRSVARGPPVLSPRHQCRIVLQSRAIR